ncbi:MAG TPA: GNAT family N-acetyltransferase [Noviherbaspirillum sp.]
MNKRKQEAIDPGSVRSVNNAVAVQMTAWSDISIQCYENDIPPFIGSALERLYGNLFSSLAYYRAFGGADNASAYVVREGKTIVCAWLYRRYRNTVRVINEGIHLDQDDVTRFVSYIFARYPQVNVISFHAVRPNMVELPMPYQRFNCLEDMVLTLPASADAYTGSLGRSTRSYIHRYLNKLKRDFPSFCFRVATAADIGEETIREIIEFNRKRMAIKGKASINDDDMVHRIIQLAGECGMVGMIMLDGRVCAGSVNYRVGDNYFLETLAHDPEYDDYRLGTLCCYLTICECIARGGHEYHFLWGQDEYKARLLGVQRDLDDLVIYRSHWHMLFYGRLVMQHVANGFVRRLRIWVRAERRKDSLGGRLVNRLWRLVRGVRAARP